jgi:hypothetical protein
MAKPFLPIALFLVWFVAFDASAQKVEVAKVPMPPLAPLQRSYSANSKAVTISRSVSI